MRDLLDTAATDTATPIDGTDDQIALSAENVELPVIDLSGLHTGSQEDMAAVAKALGDAARTSGFFYIRNRLWSGLSAE